jgi:hypothetical protein
MEEWTYRSTYSSPRHLLEASGKLHVSAALPPSKESPGTNWIGGWVGPRNCLDDMDKRKILPLPELELRFLGSRARSQSLYRLRYSGSCLYLKYAYSSVQKLWETHCFWGTEPLLNSLPVTKEWQNYGSFPFRGQISEGITKFYKSRAFIYTKSKHNLKFFYKLCLEQYGIKTDVLDYILSCAEVHLTLVSYITHDCYFGYSNFLECFLFPQKQRFGKWISVTACKEWNVPTRLGPLRRLDDTVMSNLIICLTERKFCHILFYRETTIFWEQHSFVKEGGKITSRRDLAPTGLSDCIQHILVLLSCPLLKAYMNISDILIIVITLKLFLKGVRIVESVQRLATGWKAEGSELVFR